MYVNNKSTKILIHHSKPHTVTNLESCADQSVSNIINYTFFGTLVMIGLGRVLKMTFFLMRAETV